MAQQIDLQSARDLVGDPSTAFIDIRDFGSFEDGHLPGAISASENTIDAFLKSTSRDTRVVVYCYHGHSSLQAADWFSSQGFTDVVSMSGGFTAWRFAAMNDPSFGIDT